MTRTEDLVGLVRPDIGDLSTQGANNYEYDAIGRKMKDISENITSINWTPTDKIRKVVQGETTFEHCYDALGWRVKTLRTDAEGTHITHYVRDASGNILGIYENETQKEAHIYGSSRIGSYIVFSQKYTQTLGFGRYELTNHLGSVLSVISDNKHKNGTTYTARIISQTDYYAYGWQLSGRIFSESPQRHGYQGSEKSPYTNGNYTTFFRELDTRNPHWWSVDPKFNPSESPYVSMGANPVWANDVLGDTTFVFTKNGKYLDMLDKHKKKNQIHFFENEEDYLKLKNSSNGSASKLSKSVRNNSYAYLDDRGFEILKSVFFKSDTETAWAKKGWEEQKLREGKERLFVLYKTIKSRQLIPIDLSDLMDIQEQQRLLKYEEDGYYKKGDDVSPCRELTSIHPTGRNIAIDYFLNKAMELIKGGVSIIALGHSHLKFHRDTKTGKFLDPAKPTLPEDYESSYPNYPPHAGIVLTNFNGVFKLSIYQHDKQTGFKVVTFE